MPSTHRRIAVILPLESDHSGRLLQGALRYAKAKPAVTLIDVFYPVDEPARLKPADLLGFDAAMIWASRDATWVESLIERQLPIMAVSGDWPVDRVPCVSFDSKAVVRTAVEHLTTANPAYLLYTDFRLHGLPIKEGRSRLFCELASHLRIPSESYQIFEPEDDGDSEAARRLPLATEPTRRLRGYLRSLPLPLGIWCGEDHLARRVCEIVTDLGLRIPEDVSILGLGDFPVAECGTPPLSSLPLPGERIGYHATGLLHQQLISGEKPAAFTPISPPPVTCRESTGGRGSDDVIGRAASLISRRACEGVTVKQVAAAVGLSPQSLHSRFFERHGHSPAQQIRLKRLAEAKRHLADPSLTISQVAAMCGFDQANRFSNFLRRETGLSPRDWRKEHV